LKALQYSKKQQNSNLNLLDPKYFVSKSYKFHIVYLLLGKFSLKHVNYANLCQCIQCKNVHLHNMK